MNKTVNYSGCDNLEVMASAHNYNAYLISLLGTPKKSQKILDFGAGSGTFADELKAMQAQIDCVEPDVTLAKTLKKKGYTVFSDAKDLTAKYDIIYTFNVFEHIKDDEKSARTLVNHLNPGGTLVIYVPAFQTLFSSMDTKVGHYRRYRRAMLKELLADHNVAISKLQYCDPIGFFATLAFKLVGNANGDLSLGSIKFYDRFIFPISRFIEPLTKHFFGKNAVIIVRGH